MHYLHNYIDIQFPFPSLVMRRTNHSVIKSLKQIKINRPSASSADNGATYTCVIYLSFAFDLYLPHSAILFMVHKLINSVIKLNIFCLTHFIQMNSLNSNDEFWITKIVNTKFFYFVFVSMTTNHVDFSINTMKFFVSMFSAGEQVYLFAVEPMYC